jgi:hypothetical protein
MAIRQAGMKKLMRAFIFFQPDVPLGEDHAERQNQPVDLLGIRPGQFYVVPLHYPV